MRRAEIVFQAKGKLVATKNRKCKCGRDWEPLWITQFKYFKRCYGCGKNIKYCNCKIAKQDKVKND